MGRGPLHYRQAVSHRQAGSLGPNGGKCER